MIDDDKYIKVNIPSSEEGFREGFGEGVFVIVDEDVRKLYDEDDEGTICEGILDNDCLYYPELKHGVIIPFEMRGDKRPVVLFSWLKENYKLADASLVWSQVINKN